MILPSGGGLAMIFKRSIAKLRAQDWTAITIEFVIVIVGVFIGVMVANWNEARLERANTIRLLNQFKPELRYQFDQFDRLQAYLTTTGDYAKIALAGWDHDPKVTDSQFVISAYQASQATGSTTNTQAWASIFGGSQVQNISDPELRARLVRVLSIDFTLTDYHQIQSAYRENVRHVIPDDIQERIRDRCGDHVVGDSAAIYYLPPRCEIALPPDRVRAAAAALRAHPGLVNDLYWHRALAATMLLNWQLYITALHRLSGFNRLAVLEFRLRTSPRKARLRGWGVPQKLLNSQSQLVQAFRIVRAHISPIAPFSLHPCNEFAQLGCYGGHLGDQRLAPLWVIRWIEDAARRHAGTPYWSAIGDRGSSDAVVDLVKRELTTEVANVRQSPSFPPAAGRHGVC